MATLQADPIAVIEPLETRMQARLATLRAERDTYLGNAQRQLAAFDAAIGELGALLEPPAADQNGAKEPGGD